MKNKYKIVVEGKNYNIRLEEGPQKCGFFATRFIEANNSSEAENIVMELIRDELNGIILNDRFDPPILCLEELIELSSFGDNDIPGGGFSWYKEECK